MLERVVSQRLPYKPLYPKFPNLRQYASKSKNHSFRANGNGHSPQQPKQSSPAPVRPPFWPTNSKRILATAVVGASVILAGIVLVKPDLFVLNKSTRDTFLTPKYASPKEIQLAIEELNAAFPDTDLVDTDPDSLHLLGSSDNSYLPASPHSVIVRPTSTEDVVKIMNISRKYRLPIVAYSGGTSLEGHFSGHPEGSICLDMSGMDKILAIREEDSDMTVQSGVHWEDINQTLKDKNIPLFFPLDPGPGATIGGMVGTGCSGTNAVRYGTAKAEWFLNLTVVLPSGEVIKTRSRARKSSAGFDVTKLFIGAEGTLGIVTEATIRLAPLLPTKVAVASFPSVDTAVSAVEKILKSPLGNQVQCIELLDSNMVEAMNNGGFVDRKWPVKDTLLFKLQGDDQVVKSASKAVQRIVKEHGSDHFEFAATDKEAQNLWQNRKYALMSAMASIPGARCWTTDVCVPVSNLPKLVKDTKEDLKANSLPNAILGHVGDGNFHALILFQEDSELPKVHGAVHRMVQRALKLDGTCSGEHGVGIGKKAFLPEELGPGTVELMKTIKTAVDPLNLLNPGKLYPDNDRQEQQ